MVFGLPSENAFAAGGGGAVVSVTLLYWAGLMTQYINQCSNKKEKGIIGECRGLKNRQW